MELVGEPIHSVGALLRQWTQAHRQKYWRWLDFRAKKLTLVTGWQGLAVSRHARWSNQYLGTTLGRREAQQLTKFASGRICDFNWFPDGKQLLVTRGEMKSDVVLISNLR